MSLSCAAAPCLDALANVTKDIRITTISSLACCRYRLSATASYLRTLLSSSYPRLTGARLSPMSYKVEELLALRDSVSESAVSIEKFADEDVIKGR